MISGKQVLKKILSVHHLGRSIPAAFVLVDQGLISAFYRNYKKKKLRQSVSWSQMDINNSLLTLHFIDFFFFLIAACP